jgi:hypothetical protein
MGPEDPLGERLTTPPLKCEACDEVIGVYEPVVVVTDDEIRETSRAAEPTIGSWPGARYHRGCYLERFGMPAAYSRRP